METISKLLSKIRFRNPEKSRVVIFDSSGSEILEKAVLYDIPHSILPANMEVYHISLPLIFFMLKNVRVVLDRIIKPTGKNRLKNIVLHAYRLYYLACMECIRPQVVITFIDNSDIFQWLSRNYRRAEFYAIQNGIRDKWCLTTALTFSSEEKCQISMPNYFCFGPYVEDLFHQYEQQVDNYYPVGSIKADYFKAEKSDFARSEIKYDICLLSAWRENIMMGNSLPEIRRALEKLCNYLELYISRHNLSLCVATCSLEEKNLINEINYYDKYFGSNYTISSRRFDNLKTYDSMEKSSVMISTFSTVAIEAYGWGKKVLMCNFFNVEDYYIPIDEICSVNEPDYDTFECKLTKLINMSESEYCEKTQLNAQYLMVYNPDRPAHVAIRDIIMKTLHA